MCLCVCNFEIHGLLMKSVVPKLGKLVCNLVSIHSEQYESGIYTIWQLANLVCMHSEQFGVVMLACPLVTKDVGPELSTWFVNLDC